LSVEQKRRLINQLQKALGIGDRCVAIQFSIQSLRKSKDPTFGIEAIKEVVQWVNSPELSSCFDEIERLGKNPSEAFEDWGIYTRLEANLNGLESEVSDELRKIIIDIKALAINLGYATENELAHINNDCLYDNNLTTDTVEFFEVMLRRAELSLPKNTFKQWADQSLVFNSDLPQYNVLAFKYSCREELSRVESAILQLEYDSKHELAKRLELSLNDSVTAIERLDNHIQDGGDYDIASQYRQEAQGAIYSLADLLEKIDGLLQDNNKEALKQFSLNNEHGNNNDNQNAIAKQYRKISKLQKNISSTLQSGTKHGDSYRVVEKTNGTRVIKWGQQFEKEKEALEELLTGPKTKKLKKAAQQFTIPSTLNNLSGHVDYPTHQAYQQIQFEAAYSDTFGKTPAKKEAENDSGVADEWLRVSEIADRFGKSPSRITQLCNDGTIDSRGKGRERKVSLLSASKYFTELEKRKIDQKRIRTGRDSMKDDSEVERDGKRMNRKGGL